MRLSSCCIWAALFLLLIVGCAAQAPAPASDCSAALVSLLPCLDYVQGNVSAPSQSCCGGLGSVVQSTPSCLCTLFSNSSNLPISVNTTRALQLPALCKVATPNPAALCGGGVVAPVQEPVPSPPVMAPATPPVAAMPPPVATPAMTPTLAPATPMTPSLAPSTTPVVAPAPVAPVVAPSVPPSAEVPAPAPTPLLAPATTPNAAPTLAPSSQTPLPSVSSPPAPPPASDQSHGAAVAASSFLLSAFAIVATSILFSQL